MRPVKPPAALNEHYDRAANADRRIRYRVAGVNISVLVKMLETPLDCDGYDQRHAADERNSDERAGGQVPNLALAIFVHGSPLRLAPNRQNPNCRRRIEFRRNAQRRHGRICWPRRRWLITNRSGSIMRQAPEASAEHPCRKPK